MLLSKQNNVDISQIYDVLHNSLDNLLPENWLQALVVAEIDDDESGLTYGRYLASDSSTQWQSFDTDYTHYIIFDTLRERLYALLQTKWNKATVTFDKEGQIATTFEYESTD